MDWLKKRKKEQFSRLFTQDPHQASWHWLCSSSDWGVVRNGGRRGAAHAPQAIQATYSKLYNRHIQEKYYQWETSCPTSEARNFVNAQQEEASRTQQILQKFPQKNYLHLGGGHDHIYPFLKAILQVHPQKNLHVLNLDAHLDTRAESEPHSGTPFRQILKEYPGRIRLTQIGIQAHSNSSSSYENLDGMEVYTLQDLKQSCPNMNKQAVQQWAEQHLQKWKGEIQILSLDCDALSSHFMEAVSAVNAEGLSLSSVSAFFQFYCQHNSSSNWFIGIYEMNPLYDNLSQKGARAISSLLLNCQG